MNGHSNAVLSVTISPNGEILASGSADKTIRLWDVKTWQQRYILTEHLGAVNTLAISFNIWSQIQSLEKFTLDSILSGEWWEILGVNQGNHPKDVKLAYPRLAILYHPDVNSSAIAKASMQAINRAYKEFQQ